jgi:hypothetical protein
MGFAEAHAGLLEALRAEDYLNWPRADERQKNWLEYERVSPQELRRMLLRCNGTQHRESAYHGDARFRVHEFFPEWHGERWYVKAFFDPEMSLWVFMSVHPSEDR